MTRLRWSAVETALTMYSTELYQQLEDEGYHTGSVMEIPPNQVHYNNIVRQPKLISGLNPGVIDAVCFSLDSTPLEPLS